MRRQGYQQQSPAQSVQVGLIKVLGYFKRMIRGPKHVSSETKQPPLIIYDVTFRLTRFLGHHKAPLYTMSLHQCMDHILHRMIIRIEIIRDFRA